MQPMRLISDFSGRRHAAREHEQGRTLTGFPEQQVKNWHTLQNVYTKKFGIVAPCMPLTNLHFWHFKYQNELLRPLVPRGQKAKLCGPVRVPES